MWENLLVMLIVFSVVLGYDLPRLKQQNRKTKIVYGTLIIVASYLGIDFVFDTQLPHLTVLLDWTLTQPSKQIIDMLKVY